MSWTYTIIAALAALWFCWATLAQFRHSEISFKAPNAGKGNNIVPAYSDFVGRILKESKISGLSLAVVRTDGRLELGAWGNKTEEGEPVTTDTLFYIGSLSKAFTASALGILMDDFAHGRNKTALPPGLNTFDWNTKVKDILPGQWSLKDEWASEKASIRDILAHVSGMPRHDNSYGPFDTPQNIISKLPNLEPYYELRETWCYNNMMYITAAHIISTYAGSFTTFVKERIFDPLNMTSTTYSLSEAAVSGRMTQAWTSIENGRRIPHWFDDELNQSIAGAGGVISSAADMAKWVETYLNSGLNRRTNTTVIPKSTLDEITTPHFVVNGPEKALFAPDSMVAGYGAGWARSSIHGLDIISHGGSLPGFSTLISYLPMSGVGLVALANGDGKHKALLDIQNRIYKVALCLNDNMDGINVQSEHQMLVPNFPVTTRMPPIALDDYAGTYHNPGYGAFTLCPPSSNSSYCTQVKSDFTSICSDEKLRLLAAWPRVWSSHLRMVHFDDNIFIVEFTALFPRGYGVNTSPFEVKGDTSSVKFITEDGRVIGFELRSIEGRVDALFKKYT